MSCATTKFPAYPFYGTDMKPHGVRVLIKYYHLQTDPKLDNGTFTLRKIPWACVARTNMLYNPWDPGVDHDQKQ